MLVLNLPFKALMFLTLMRPSLVLFLVLWLKLVKDFLKEIGRAVQQECPRPISYAVFCLKKKKKDQDMIGEIMDSLDAFGLTNEDEIMSTGVEYKISQQ